MRCKEKLPLAFRPIEDCYDSEPICAVWPENSLCTLGIIKESKLLQMDNKGSDQTMQMHRHVQVYCIFIFLHLGVSYLSELGTSGLLNLGKKHLDHPNWENFDAV